MDGRTLTCCRNPTGFGNWIENGVDGTWNAPEFVRFREKIITGEYPDEFCELCDSNGTALSLRQLLEPRVNAVEAAFTFVVDFFAHSALPF